MLQMIIETYMSHLAENPDQRLTVQRLCQICGYHRSTFYRYFEGARDLDDRFLELFFQLRPTQILPGPVTVEQLFADSIALVEWIRRKSEFFTRIRLDPRMSHYLQQWVSLMADEAERRNQGIWRSDRDQLSIPGLYRPSSRMYFDLVERAFEAPPAETGALVRTFWEFVAGGALRAEAASQGSLSCREPSLSRVLKHRGGLGVGTARLIAVDADSGACEETDSA